MGWCTDRLAYRFEVKLVRIQAALGQAAGRRAWPGPDGVTSSKLQHMHLRVRGRLQEAMQRRACWDADAEGIAWDAAATTSIGKRRGPAHHGHFRPITTANKLEKVWASVYVLLEPTTLHAESLLNDSVFGLRPHRQTSDATLFLARLVAHACSTKEGLLIGKLDITHAFDSTNIDVPESPAIFTCTRAHLVWKPCHHIGSRRDWGVMVDGEHLMRLT